jgi:hypothetical protein
MLFSREPSLDEDHNLASSYPDVMQYFENQASKILAGNYEVFTAQPEDYKIRATIRKMKHVF